MVSLYQENKQKEAADLVKGGLGKHYTDEIRRLSEKASRMQFENLQKRRIANETLILKLNRYLYYTIGLVFLFFLFNFFQLIRFFRKQKLIQERLKQNEEIFSTLFYKSPVMKWIVNEETRQITDVNDAICEFFGFSKVEMTGKTADQIGILLPPGIRETLNKQLQLKGKLRNVEVYTSNKKGEKKWISIDIDPINLYGTKSLIAAMLDITERKESELHVISLNEELEGKVLLKTKEIRESEEKLKILNEQLELKVQERTEQLEKANKELEAFSYSVSHDLRAPLRSINGFATIIEEDYGNKMDDEEKRLLSVIKTNTQKMGNLIDDLLAFSRMGRKEISKSAIDTQKMVTEVIHDLSPQETTKISWIIHALPSCWGDANTIPQVWVNLISNAIKYSRKKEIPEIEIGGFAEEGQTVFYVKDNGVGFDETYSNKLFRVFQRLHSESEFEGTGVGLALADKIISKHGGKMWATSKPDKGACFYFSLPDNQYLN